MIFTQAMLKARPFVTISTSQAEGSTVNWCLTDQRTTPHRLICRYPATVIGGHVSAHIPARFARLIATGETAVYVELPA